MNKLEKELSEQINEIIVSCAIGMGCDEAKLKRLASEYGNVSHSYTLSKKLLAFDFEHEKQTALQLEKKVNDVIIQQRRIYGELGSRRSSFKIRKPKTPSPTKASPKASPKTRRSYCNMMGGKRRTNTKRRRN